MLYLHDLWVNWFKDEENPHLVPYFHEWKKSDKVELMDQIPLLQVNPNLFNFIVYGLNQMPADILEKVKEKAYTRKNHERLAVKYAFVCTDGKEVIAIELSAKGCVSKKSRLIPRQHLLSLELIVDMPYDFELNDNVDTSNYKKYLGLTRLEKQILNISSDFIENLFPDKLGMLKYLVAEWDTHLHRKLKAFSFDEIKTRLLEEIKSSEIGKLVMLNGVIEKLKIIN
jgi:hypothetical protein